MNEEDGEPKPVTSRIFDRLDRLESETRRGDQTVACEYDAKGNRTKVTDPEGVSTGYTYDALDRPTRVTLADEDSVHQYWPDGRLKGVDYPNGLRERRCYDDAGRLVQIVSAKEAIADDCSAAVPYVGRYHHSYDANGNRLTLTEQRTSPTSQALTPPEETGYRYDALDRLTAVRYPDGRIVAYELDAVGNRKGERETLAGRFWRHVHEDARVSAKLRAAAARRRTRQASCCSGPADPGAAMPTRRASSRERTPHPGCFRVSPRVTRAGGPYSPPSPSSLAA